MFTFILMIFFMGWNEHPSSTHPLKSIFQFQQTIVFIGPLPPCPFRNCIGFMAVLSSILPCDYLVIRTKSFSSLLVRFSIEVYSLIERFSLEAQKNEVFSIFATSKKILFRFIICIKPTEDVITTLHNVHYWRGWHYATAYKGLAVMTMTCAPAKQKFIYTRHFFFLEKFYFYIYEQLRKWKLFDQI